MTVEFIITQLEARKKRADYLRAEMQKVLDAQKVPHWPTPAEFGPPDIGPVIPDVLDRILERVKEEFGLHTESFEGTVQSLQRMADFIGQHIGKLREPVGYVLEQDGRKTEALVYKSEVEDLLRTRFFERTELSQEWVEELEASNVYPVFGFGLELRLARVPNDLESQLDDAEADEFELYLNSRKVDTFSELEYLLEAVESRVTEDGEDLDDFTFVKIERSTHSLRCDGNYDLKVDLRD